MDGANGSEMAVIERRGPSGRLGDNEVLTVGWSRAHREIEILDPFAALANNSKTLKMDGKSSTVTLEGYQEALLVIAR